MPVIALAVTSEARGHAQDPGSGIIPESFEQLEAWLDEKLVTGGIIMHPGRGSA